MIKMPRTLPALAAALLALGLSTLTSHASMTISSLTGAVTSTEISSFESFMSGETPPSGQTYDNTLADGTAGMEAEALGMMYEVTNDPTLLNKMITYADDFLSLRNDFTIKRVMWDGSVDPVWLTKASTNSEAGYAGCENNDIAGHIAYCAKLILQTPSLWSTTVPDGDPYGYGTTYYERAQTYIGEMEETETNYMLKWFISPTNSEIVAPTNSAWTAFGESVNAWNRQMMFMSGFQRMSEIHQLLGDSPAKVAQYDAIVQAAMNWFVSDLSPYTTNSHSVYNWTYAPGSGGSEDMSLHADYDMWGVHRAYFSGRYTNLPASTLTPFGNTLQYVINLGGNTFADYVNGDSSSGTRNYIYPGWTLVGDLDPMDYFITADANIAQGSQGSTAIFDAFILWAKNARYDGRFANNTNSADFTVIAPWIETAGAGSNTTCKVTVSPVDGFGSAVTLGIIGLPAGVSGSFSPATISGGSGTSTLTLVVSNSASAGTYSLGSIAITGTGGSLTRTTPLTLVIPPTPDFSVSASPSSQNITIGNNTTYTATVSPTNGFTGTVTLSVSGLPAHVGGSFSPSTITGGSGSSTLSITTATNSPSGTYTLTVTGVSGTLTNSTTVSLLLNDFTFSASPASQTVTAGGSTNYTATVGNVNGFGGTVSLSASGLPSGATAAFNPTTIDTIGSSTMTVTTSGSTPAGTNTLTVTGTDGTLMHSATINLIVQSASNPLPAGWSDSDIGAVGLAGSAGYSGGVFTVSGSGADIWGVNDEFNYCFQLATNDFTITALVTNINSANAWSKSGVMIRGINTTNSAYVGLYVTTGNGISMQCRTANGVSAVQLADVTGITAPYWVRLVRSGNSFTGFSSSDGVTWTEVASTNISMAATVKGGLAVCSHDNTALNTSTFDNVSVSQIALTDKDIGSPGQAGSGSYSGGVYTVSGSGADIYGTNDQFNYYYQSHTTNETITARVASISSANGWSKSGVMIRETTAADSSYVGIYVTESNGVDMQYRNGTDTSAVDLARVSGVSAPYWVQLVRSGNTITGYCAPDGVTWTEVGSITVSMANTLTTGTAVCSHDNTALNTSTFDNMSIW